MYLLAACCQLKCLEAQASAAFVMCGGGGIMKVYVYVDGFNLHYRALKGTRHKWINLLELAKRVLDPQIQSSLYGISRLA
jgi:hypothetical protein